MGDMQVTYADMENASKQLQSGEHEMTNTLNQLQKLVQHLVTGGFVTNAASKQFDQSYSEFTHGAQQMMQGLGGMGKYLDTAAKTLQETDQQLAKALKG